MQVVGPPPPRLTINDLPLPNLSGRVFEDRNNDGRFDTGCDTGLAGVLLYLFDESDLLNPLGTATTDAGGYYVFAGELPGKYRIVEGQPAGYLDGKETAGSLGGIVDNTQDSERSATSPSQPVTSATATTSPTCCPRGFRGWSGRISTTTGRSISARRPSRGRHHADRRRRPRHRRHDRRDDERPGHL